MNRWSKIAIQIFGPADLVFPESRIHDIVDAVNECRLSQAYCTKSEILITICCVPPRFKPFIILIPVYRGPAREAYEAFGHLFHLNPISVLPTYIRDVFPIHNFLTFRTWAWSSRGLY